MHVGQQFVDRLVEYGVRRVFGVPGGQTLALYDGITRRRGRIDHVLMRSETSGVYAADAYARVAGQVGICDATVGPGTAHLVPGLLEALTSSIPVLAVVGDIPRQWPHRRKLASAAQGFDQAAFLEPCVKHFGRVEIPEVVHRVLDACLRAATAGRPGPAAIELPVDLLEREAQARDLELNPDDIRFPRFRPAPDPDALEQAIAALAEARRPVVVAGGGAIISGCGAELVALAESLGSPITTTVSGKGIVAETHPLSLGVCGTFGIPPANEALRQADCVLFVGTKAGQTSTMSWKLPARGVRTIHIDVDPDELGRNYHDSIGVHADARVAVAAMLGRWASDGAAGEWLTDDLAASRDGWWERDAWAPTGAVESGGITPPEVFSALRDLIQPGDVVVADASLASGWAASRWQTAGGGRVFLAPRGMAGLGWGLPAAIGAALAVRDRDGREPRVLCIAGDGAWAYSVAELETVARLGLNIKSIVLNNHTLAWTKHVAAEAFGPDVVSQDFLDVDFATVATGFGCRAERVAEGADVTSALTAAIADSGSEPAVLDIVCDPAETPVQKLRDAAASGADATPTGY